MDLSLSSRFKNAWNAFRNRAPTMMSQNIGSGYSYRPDRFRLTRGNERSIVTSVYNRIALDVAAINIQHVQLDDEGRFLNVIKSGLNECLSLEANLDQTGRAFIQDVVMSMMDEGCVVIVPVDTDDDPDDTKGYQILSMRVGRIRDWYPRHVRVEVYNENTGRKQEIVVPKDTVAIVENPLYAVINEPNSTMQRLIRKLNLLDAVDEQSSSGKLDLIIQLPYVIKSEARRKQAEQRRKDIEQQLSGSKYGMGKTANDAATKVKTFTQLFDTLKEAAQSGWTQSWEIIVGDFEEAKELLTEVSDTFSAVINASADARNKMLQDWKDLGGRTMMIEAVKNVFEGLVTSLIIFGAAIKILASACEDLSKLQWDELGRGLTGVGVLFAEIAVFLRVAKFNGKMISTATGIVILSAAMKVLASACKDFGQMEWSEIGKGLAGIGGLLAELAVFTNLAGNAKHVMSTGVALIAIGAAMKIFASAVKDFGQLQWDEIGRGLTAMGGALAEVAIAVNLMPKNMIGIGTGLVIVGGALEIIANCMSKFGGMQWEEIGRGLTVMGGALAELAISLNFMKGTLGGSAALLVASGALAVLAPVLSILGALSWEAIAKGLISIAGAFTIIGVAGAVLTPLVPTILALSGAFALIGVGVLTIGAGLLAAGTGLSALAIGFTALATAGAAGATAIVAALTVIVTGIAGLIPAVLTKVGEGIIAICKVIAAGAPAIGEAVKAVVLTLIDVFVSCVPQLADGALQLVVGVLAALVTYTPQIVDLAFKFLIGILDGIASNLPSLIKAGVDVLVAFFAGIVDALRGIDTGALLKGIAGIGLLSAIMLALSATASLVPGAMVGILGMGAVVAEMALVLAAVGLLSKLPGLSWLIGEGGKLLQGIGTAIGQFVGGIVGGFMSGVSSQFPQIGADLSTFMNNVQQSRLQTILAIVSDLIWRDRRNPVSSSSL